MLLERFAELEQRLVRVALQGHLHDDRLGKTNRSRIQADGVALDHALLFHLA